MTAQPLLPLALYRDARPIGERTAAERYQTPSMFDWVPIEATRQACADRRESTRLCTCTPANCCRTVHKPLEEVL